MKITRRGLLLAAPGIAAWGAEASGAHPTVYLTARDVERAKQNISRYQWAREAADDILHAAEPWLWKEDEWIRAAVPPPGTAFAYGFTGCPVCGGSLGPWWGSARTSFDNPGHVTCMKGHLLPDAAHPDSGKGYASPDGRIYYFAGVYNAWVVETLDTALDSLAYAYTLTGDERYAAKASVLFDALAASYPGCDKGSWDYPSNPNMGRFNRNWYQVSRVLVHYVDAYDQLYNSKSLDARSSVTGLTRRRNIEENLLKNGAKFCYEQSLKGGLHNGEADYERGALAVGLCLGLPDYVRWAVDGPYGIRTLLANNVDRDGAYFESSTMYANHTRDLYSTFAEPLFNSSAHRVDLYRDPRFRAFLLLHNLAQNCAGHAPSYGDTPPDLRAIAAPAHPFDASDYTFLRRLYARAGDAAERGELAGIQRWLERGRPAEATESDAARHARDVGGEGSSGRWALFHSSDVPPGPAVLPAALSRRLTQSDFFGQKGLGVLRAGEGASAQAVLMRFGPSLVHGQADDLNFNYYACGSEVTYHLGYLIDSSHTYRGWAAQTASHNVVVVNEKSQMEDGGTGGSLHLFADVPATKLIDASSEASYAAQGVTLYRRALALLGENPRYLLDVFRVEGGAQHDWMFHSRADRATFDGVALGPEEPGSLAGPDISWGDKQLNDGDIDGHGGQRGWTPTPRNGYGFLVRPQRGRPDGQWHADWTIDGGTHVRVTMPAAQGTEVATAVAPGIHPGVPHARYAIVRRRGEKLSSQFVAAIEAYTGSPLVRGIERLPLAPPAAGVVPVAVKIALEGGIVDYVFSAADAEVQHAEGIVFSGSFAHARVQNGKLASLSLAGASEFSGFGWRVRPRTAEWSGTVTAVDPERSTITTDATLPSGRLDGQLIVFANPAYSRNTAYRIARIEKTGAKRIVHLSGTVVLGRGMVQTVAGERSVVCPIPHEYARPHRSGGDTTFFRGKRIRAASGAATTIIRVQYGRPMTLEVAHARIFQPGETFYYDDLQPGDRFTVPSVVSLRTDTRPYRLEGNVEADVRTS